MALKSHCNTTRTGTAARAPARIKPFVQWPQRGAAGQPAAAQQHCSLASAAAGAPAPAPRPRSARLACPAAAMADSPAAAAKAAGPALICTSVTATNMKAFLEEIKEAEASGVDVVELRLDFISDFDPERDLDTLMKACTLPYIVTYRPKWEG
jgi:hypothetical protein